MIPMNNMSYTDLLAHLDVFFVFFKWIFGFNSTTKWQTVGLLCFDWPKPTTTKAKPISSPCMVPREKDINVWHNVIIWINTLSWHFISFHKKIVIKVIKNNNWTNYKLQNCPNWNNNQQTYDSQRIIINQGVNWQLKWQLSSIIHW